MNDKNGPGRGKTALVYLLIFVAVVALVSSFRGMGSAAASREEIEFSEFIDYLKDMTGHDSVYLVGESMGTVIMRIAPITLKLSPAVNIIAQKVSAVTIVVERSGSLTIRRRGTAISRTENSMIFQVFS